MKIKMGFKFTVYTYSLGSIPVAKIVDHETYGVSYYPKTEQIYERLFQVQFPGRMEILRSFDDCEGELKFAAKDAFKYLVRTEKTSEEIKEVDVPEKV